MERLPNATALDTARQISLFFSGPGGAALFRDLASRRAEIHEEAARVILDPRRSLDGDLDDLETLREEIQAIDYAEAFLGLHAQPVEVATPEARAALA